MQQKILAGGALAVGAAGVIWVAVLRRNEPSLGAGLNAVTADYCRIIVLTDGVESVEATVRARCLSAGEILFFRNQRDIRELEPRLAGHPLRIRQLVGYLQDDRGLHDADRLAFLDGVRELWLSVPRTRSTKLCSACGYKNDDLSLSEREWAGVWNAPPEGL